MNPNTRKLVGVCGALVVAAAIALLVAFFAFPDSLKFGEDGNSSSQQNVNVETMSGGSLSDAVARGQVTKENLNGYSNENNVDGIYKGKNQEMDPMIQQLIVEETREQYLESLSNPKQGSLPKYNSNVEKSVLSEEDIESLSVSEDTHGIMGKLVSKASDYDRSSMDAFELKGQTACYPMNGDELYGAAMDPNCMVVVLQKSDEDYMLPHDIVVTDRKVIVGHPIYKPTIDAGDALRAFTVKKGVT